MIYLMLSQPANADGTIYGAMSDLLKNSGKEDSFAGGWIDGDFGLLYGGSIRLNPSYALTKSCSSTDLLREFLKFGEIG